MREAGLKGGRVLSEVLFSEVGCYDTKAAKQEAQTKDGYSLSEAVAKLDCQELAGEQEG